MYTVDYLFSKDSEWGAFHDVIVQIRTGEYTVQQLRRIFESLPTSIKDDAQVWGISDTVVRDIAYVYLTEHPELIDAALEQQPVQIIQHIGHKGDRMVCPKCTKRMSPEEVKAATTATAFISWKCECGYETRGVTVKTSTAVTEMDRVVRCLALELPGAVWDDVNAKWQNLKDSVLTLP